MSKLRILTISVLVLFFLIGIGFAIWAGTPLGPMPEALAALESDSKVEVTHSSWLSFKPTNIEPTTGFIFYPGGRVDPRSYAPLANQIAAEGFIVVVVPMPFNLAVFDPDRAVRVIQSYPQIQNWAIGGHSLGGAMAANFISQRPGLVDGLILWAAYPPGSSDISRLRLRVVSIYGSNDTVLAQERLEETRHLLPGNTRWVPVVGGNHAQFGWYGEQPGDSEAGINRETQQDLVVAATVELLQALEPSASR